MAHLGLQPQKFSSSNKYKIYGRGKNDLTNILQDASQLEKAGAISILLEGVISNVAKQVTKSVSIPTIGIGASKYCDGQVLVIDDIINLDSSNYKQKFIKTYTNIESNIINAVKNFTKDVKNKKFPSKKYSY